MALGTEVREALSRDAEEPERLGSPLRTNGKWEPWQGPPREVGQDRRRHLRLELGWGGLCGQCLECVHLLPPAH